MTCRREETRSPCQDLSSNLAKKHTAAHLPHGVAVCEDRSRRRCWLVASAPRFRLALLRTRSWNACQGLLCSRVLHIGGWLLARPQDRIRIPLIPLVQMSMLGCGSGLLISSGSTREGLVMPTEMVCTSCSEPSESRSMAA